VNQYWLNTLIDQALQRIAMQCRHLTIKRLKKAGRGGRINSRFRSREYSTKTFRGRSIFKSPGSYRADRKTEGTKETGRKHSSTFHLLLLPSSISSFFLSEETEI
jgi:hypothetical protein